ncbi:MAG: hypothetical protein NUW37_17535 [Planctomycetes bacterium]|nr:hypothetical protein [Planctomycetota bacterium]
MTAYKDYKLCLKIKSPAGTPWQSDTIMGSLAFIHANFYPDTMVNFIESFASGNPPFIVSDGFPRGLLPKPLSWSVQPDEDDGAMAKLRKKQTMVAAGDFDKIRAEPSHSRYAVISEPWMTHRVLHAAINRETGTTFGEGMGGLYETSGTYPRSKNSEIEVYVRARDDSVGRVEELFVELSKTGYGCDKSVGLGQFEIMRERDTILQEHKFIPVNGANGFVSISSFVPSKSDPTDGKWKYRVKYGKLGENISGNVFKKPLIMLESGSAFRLSKPPAAYYGRIVRNVAPGKPEAVQFGFAYPVLCKI